MPQKAQLRSQEVDTAEEALQAFEAVGAFEDSEWFTVPRAGFVPAQCDRRRVRCGVNDR